MTVLGQVAAYIKMIRDLDSALEFIKMVLSLIEQYDLGIRGFFVPKFDAGMVCRRQTSGLREMNIYLQSYYRCKKIGRPNGRA